MLRARVYPALWQTALIDRHGGASIQQQHHHLAPLSTTIAAICSSTILGLGLSTGAGRLGRFGGAVDIIVVEQKDGSLKSTPWYVQFAKFQSLLRQNSRSVAVSVNDVDAGFRMYLNRWGTPYLLQDEESCSTTAGSRGIPESVEMLGETEGLIRRWYSRRWYGKRRLQSPIPSSDQLAALGLKEGRNKVSFTVTSPLLGKRQIDASIFLMKWDAKLIISDVDGTITRSDVLGQVMPLVGRDWSQMGVARLFSALKDNGYKLVFLSARAITQAHQTRQFLANLMQDGEKLPDGPVVLSPAGIFPSLYREVIRRTPHEFKIACLQQIREVFPSDYNPFYAGFGNRHTDVFSYLKVGVPPERIFTINPRGELLAHNAVDVTCYTSLHKLVDEMFPPMPR